MKMTFGNWSDVGVSAQLALSAPAMIHATTAKATRDFMASFPSALGRVSSLVRRPLTQSKLAQFLTMQSLGRHARDNRSSASPQVYAVGSGRDFFIFRLLGHYEFVRGPL